MKFCRSFVVLTLSALALMTLSEAGHTEELKAFGTDSGARPAGALHSSRSTAMSLNGMAATSHSLATQVAVDILRKGGSAVDAAIAANAMLALVEPFMCGPGGDLFAIVWDPQSAKLHGLNASGRAPADFSRDELIATLGPDARTLPLLGPLTVTVPGAVEGWYALHARFGKLPMAEVLAPAVHYARQGVPTPEVIASTWEVILRMYQRMAEPGENFADTFMPDGRSPEVGEVFRNPDLASFFEELGREGPDYFYRGAAGDAIVQRVSSAGGHLTRNDLDSHRSTWVEPVSINYRGYDIYELPPNGQGIAALQMLTILEGFNLRAMGRQSPDFWHLMIESKKLAYEDRARHYADPEYMTMPVERLLSETYAAERREMIEMESTMQSAEAGVESIADGDTVYLTTADADGMMVSLIQSLAGPFGSGLVPEGLGFALQNRGIGFALEGDHPNAYGPGKRPFHTIIPAFVMKDGAPWMSFGLMGGDMQPQGHVQILVNLIDFDMDLQAAGDAARFRHSGSSGPGRVMADGGRIAVEPGISEQALRELRRRGHTIELARGESHGGYQAIIRDPDTGVLIGATEMRKDGSAAGY
jgi:gamma-glutamyltranspeptidase/glutathione hydrolase